MTAAEHTYNSSLAQRQKQSAAWKSILVTLLLIATKLLVALFTGSLAILSQAADSTFDLVAVIVTLLAVRVSSIPPDEDHPYGHGKFENLSALLQSVLLLGVTVYIGYEAIGRLFRGHEVAIEVGFWSFAVLLLSICADAWRARMLHRAAKEHNSQALGASALNFMMDILSAVVAIVALACVKLLGWEQADAWAALVVAASVGYLSIRLGVSAVDGLTDRFPLLDIYRQLQSTIQNTEHVEELRRLRVRQAGPVHFLDVSVSVDRTLPFSTVQRVILEIEQRLKGILPEADVTVHWQPIQTDRETPFNTLKHIAGEYGILPHNVEMTRDESGKIGLDYHLEFPQGMHFKDAHDLADEMADKVRRALPRVDKVTVHLEEERSDETMQEIADLTLRLPELVEEIAQFAKDANPNVIAVKDLELSESLISKERKLILTLELGASVPLAKAHDIVTNVEEELKKRYPELGRVLIHSHPVE